MYTVLRGGILWAYQDIPPSLRAAMGGRKRFRASLKTGDRREAAIRAANFEAKWLAAIEHARKGGNWELSFYKESVEAAANDYRDALKRAKSGAEREEITSLMTDRAASIAYDIDGVPFSHSEPGEDEKKRRGYQAGLHLIEVATGQLVKLTEHLEEYLKTLKGKNRDKTIDVKRSTIEQKFATEFTYIADVQKKSVQNWVKEQAEKSVALATIRRGLSEMRGYWTYLQSIDAAPEGLSPFEKLSFAVVKKNAKADERRPFEPTDVLKLLAAARKDQPLADLIQIAMWTGARLEEICALKVAKVDLKKGYIEIVDAKTSAGWRQVPIHSKLMSIMQRLIKASQDGHVLSGLSRNKYKDRSNAIGKRFGYLKTDEGFNKQYVFHSIRKTVATLLENASVPEGVAADILGHEKQTITYGLYSGGASLDVKRVAIEKLSYSDKRPVQRSLGR